MAMDHPDSRSLGGAKRCAASDLCRRRVGTRRSKSVDRIDGKTMERLVADRFVRSSTPETIEADLEGLWRELADRISATRAMMSNLVVFRNCPQGEEVDLDACVEEVPIEGVARRHPSRVIVLVHRDDPRRLQAPVAASITIRVFGSGETRH